MEPTQREKILILLQEVTKEANLPPVVMTMLKNYCHQWVNSQDDEQIQKLCAYFLKLAQWLQGEKEDVKEEPSNSTE